MNKNFAELVTIKDGHLVIADANGQMAVEGSASYQASLSAIQELMRRTGASPRRDDHEMVAQGVREPIRQLARYRQWTNIFFVDWVLNPAEDNRIPIDNPIGTAFISSPEGRPRYIMPGAQTFVRPDFFVTQVGLMIHWKVLQTAGWPILQRRLEEAADELARRLDDKARAIMDAAIASVSGHLVTITGGTLTKSGLDAVLKSAASIGFPITQAAINPGRLMDMTNWTQGSTSAIPHFFAPESAREQVFKQLWADGYGNIRWLVSHSVPINSIYLSGDPAGVGYHQSHGQAQSASDVDIDLGVDKHVIRQEDAYYIGNPYNLWNIIIQP
jgi:hypothetical protein